MLGFRSKNMCLFLLTMVAEQAAAVVIPADPFAAAAVGVAVGVTARVIRAQCKRTRDYSYDHVNVTRVREEYERQWNSLPKAVRDGFSQRTKFRKEKHSRVVLSTLLQSGLSSFTKQSQCRMCGNYDRREDIRYSGVAELWHRKLLMKKGVDLDAQDSNGDAPRVKFPVCKYCQARLAAMHEFILNPGQQVESEEEANTKELTEEQQLYKMDFEQLLGRSTNFDTRTFVPYVDNLMDYFKTRSVSKSEVEDIWYRRPDWGWVPPPAHLEALRNGRPFY